MPPCIDGQGPLGAARAPTITAPKWSAMITLAAESNQRDFVIGLADDGDMCIQTMHSSNRRKMGLKQS